MGLMDVIEGDPGRPSAVPSRLANDLIVLAESTAKLR
jgi:hypothetical protein